MCPAFWEKCFAAWTKNLVLGKVGEGCSAAFPLSVTITSVTPTRVQKFFILCNPVWMPCIVQWQNLIWIRFSNFLHQFRKQSELRLLTAWILLNCVLGQQLIENWEDVLGKKSLKEYIVVSIFSMFLRIEFQHKLMCRLLTLN